MSIAAWLERLGLAQYAQAFTDNHVSLDLLPDLTDEDLKALGVVELGQWQSDPRRGRGAQTGRGVRRSSTRGGRGARTGVA